MRTRGPQIDLLASAIDDARAAYLRDPDAVARAAAERFPFPEAYIRGYLGRLRYEFGPAERAGLAQFLQMARVAGELDRVPSIADTAVAA